MNRMLLAALTLTSLSPFAPVAQGQHALTFTTLGAEETRSGSSGSSLGTITPEDVAIVEPFGSLYSAETYASHLNWNTLAGDGDNDAKYYELPLAGHIDALQFCTTGTLLSMRDLYVSTKLDLPCASGGVIEPGDVAAIKPIAVASHLIDDTQIRSALDISTSILSFDVDAITVDSAGTIFLSFETDMLILGNSLLLEDGAVAAIPGSAVTWINCVVTSVVPSSGVIAIDEPGVDAMCVSANAADNIGLLVSAIGDLDGLAIDPNGGFFLSSDGSNTFPNLFFCGEQLTGGGILSTAGSGSIAIINLLPMAETFGDGVTDGTQVGLDPTAVQSLNGLEVSLKTCRFILDSSTPLLPSPGPVNFTAGGADPSLPVYFFARIYGANLAGSAQPSTTAVTPCFPEFFFTGTQLFVYPADPLGIVDVTAFYPGGAPAGATVVLQGLTPKTSGWSLSAPITLQF